MNRGSFRERGENVHMAVHGLYFSYLTPQSLVLAGSVLASFMIPSLAT